MPERIASTTKKGIIILTPAEHLEAATAGHEAFQAMRNLSAEQTMVAILRMACALEDATGYDMSQALHHFRRSGWKG